MIVAILVSSTPLWNRSRQVYPGEWDVGPVWIRPVNALVENTPPGERFLAHRRVEQVAAILTVDIFPTYVRDVFLPSHERAGASEAAQLELRAQAADLANAETIDANPIEILDELDIMSVCIHPDDGDTQLRLALPEKFEVAWANPRCELWVRTTS